MLIGRWPAARRRIWTRSGDGPTWTPLDPAADEPRAEVRVADLDAAGARSIGRPVSGGSVGGERTRRAGHRRDLAGEPDDRQRVAAVRLDVDVEHDVAVEVGQRAPERRVRGQDQDPVGVGGQAELVARAEHAVADDAHLLGPLDPPVAGQDRAGQRHRDALAGGDVRRAADDLERLAVTDRDPRQRQPVGARMALDRQQLADDDVLPVLAPAVDALDLHPEQRQALGELLRRQVDVDVVAQPATAAPSSELLQEAQVVLEEQAQVGDAVLEHLAIRSGPIPNAKPW